MLHFRFEAAKPNRFDVVDLLIRDRNRLFSGVANLSAKLKADKFSSKSLKEQLTRKIRVLDAVESFLMTYREDGPSDDFFQRAQALAKETLAYSLADGEERERLTNMFDGLARRIEAAVPDVDTQARYGRTLLGIDTASDIDIWVNENHAAMSVAIDGVEMLELMWPMLTRLAHEDRLRGTAPAQAIKQLAISWISGKPFKTLHQELNDVGARYPYGKQKRKFTIEMVVELCEQTFGFEFSLLLAAVSEGLSRVAFNDEEKTEFEKKMGLLQKRLKYGLPSPSSIAFFEAGFAERVVAQELDKFAGAGTATSAGEVSRLLFGAAPDAVQAFFSKYPAYFRSVYDILARRGAART